jgi:hypothetical protein
MKKGLRSLTFKTIETPTKVGFEGFEGYRPEGVLKIFAGRAGADNGATGPRT